MIKVNLLPAEYRKSDGPPVARLVALVLGAVVTAGAMGWWGYVHMNILAEAEAERIAAEEELTQVRAQAERSAALLQEFKEYQRRRETIDRIGTSRVLWSRKLDELADIVHNKGDTKQYMVWLNSVRTASPRRPDSGVSLSISGVSGGESYSKLSDFNRSIKENKEFFEDFLHADPPEGAKNAFADKKYPSIGWTFAFTLDLKQPNWREKR
jgi:hypothetical protein